ncbi:MAG: acyl-CoA synthetase (AMP-forming)/AMP-acid ligase [Microbacteriaceae bacterium]|nr:acyl-CoA synthetase (AMP-forming)/AMP-acid ligase [Microbacteriaceae bacterium]
MIVRYDQKYASIPAMVRQSAKDFGDKTYLAEGDNRWSFIDVERKMIEAAKAFIAIGVKPGDRVGLLGPNTGTWIQAALGIHAVGGIMIPLNTRFKGGELAHILNKSGAMAVVTVGDFLHTDHVGMLREAAAGSPALDNIIVLDDAVIPGTTTFTDFLAQGSQVPESEVIERIDAIEADDLSDIMFTSGTTGAPKGVPHKHGVTLRLYGNLLDTYSIRFEDIHAVVPPFFHTFGYKAGWLGALQLGITIVPIVTFNPLQLLETIEKEKVSVILGPPTIFVDLMNHPRRSEFDISSLRVAAASAASIPVKLMSDIRDVLGFEIVHNSYGLTEAHSVVATTTYKDPIELIAQSVGRAVDGVEVLIFDDDGNSVPTGETGEIMVKGFNVMDKYWDEPEETAAALTADGILHTGDIGSLDAEGNIRITDRKKDMFIVGGFNAYPAEIESMLVKHPKIQHAAVIGVADERMGEVGWAYVVPKAGMELTDREVIEYSRETLANFKVPRRVMVVQDLPRNATMKVVKFELRDQARAQQAAEAKASA